MSSDTAIRLDRVWKRFTVDRRATTLAERLRRPPALPWRRRDWRWALRDVCLDIAPGESVGLIGDNGSGKSTLLKIVNRTMVPYAGGVDVSGRVGALIDVRSGIHPELTGRENIALVGALLGLSRTQVRQRFADIVDFAQLAHAVDQQVKFYSTGMQMRLGFAVAAFLEPDVLLVDEALAVGDAGFQQRCLTSMRELISRGTTIVFVSHDLAAVQAVCRRAVWLADGRIAGVGEASEVIGAYRGSIEQRSELALRSDGPITVTDVTVSAPDGAGPVTGGALRVSVDLVAKAKLACRVCIGVSDGTASPILVARREVVLGRTPRGIDCEFASIPLPSGQYAVWLCILDRHLKDLVPWQAVTSVAVSGPSLDPAPPGISRQAPVHVDVSWTER